jgi:hypothetical protein
MAASKPSTAKAILVAGLIVGTLDAMAASIQTLQAGGTLTKLWQYVASGAFGKPAFSGGLTMVAYGLLFHYLIAFSFTVFFFALYPRLSVLAKNRLVTGVLYGIFVWAVMNLIVVRQSAIGPGPINPTKAALAAAILIVCMGLPLSYLAARHYGRNKSAARAGA